MSNTGCCVPFCTGKGGHRFPRDEKLLNQWISAIQRDFVPNHTTLVCARHFQPSDYYPQFSFVGNYRQKKRLKPDVVPSLFPWTKPHTPADEQRALRAERRNLPRKILPAAPVTCDKDIVNLLRLIPSTVVEMEDDAGAAESCWEASDSQNSYTGGQTVVYGINDFDWVKEENDEEKSDFKIIESYSMNHMTSSSTDAHVSGDCHTEIKLEPQDFTDGRPTVVQCQDGSGLLIELLLKNLQQEALSQKTCADGINEQGPLSPGVVEMNIEDDEKCSRCNQSFDSFNSLTEHLECDHLKTPQYNCIECEESVTVESELTDHIRLHEAKKPHKCSQCNYRCSFKHNLTSHIRAVHDRVKPYKCSACDKHFSYRADRDRHYKAVHCKEKPYTCEQCGHRFSGNSNYRKHMREVHAVTRDFPCKECGMRFTRKGYIEQHIRVVHLGEKPYECEVCKKTFSEKGKLRNHVAAIHEGTTGTR